MDDRIRLPRQDVSVIVKQGVATGNEEDDREATRRLQQLVRQLLDPQDKLTEEVVISSIRFREYLEVKPDGDGNVEILPDVLDAVTLEAILKNVERSLSTFT